MLIYYYRRGFMAYRDEVREFVIEKYKDNYSVKAIQQL